MDQLRFIKLKHIKFYIKFSRANCVYVGNSTNWLRLSAEPDKQPQAGAPGRCVLNPGLHDARLETFRMDMINTASGYLFKSYCQQQNIQINNLPKNVNKKLFLKVLHCWRVLK